MTTEDDLQAMLDADPTDWQTRLILADWLEDRGDERAAGYRALGMLRVWPHEFGMGDGIYFCFHNGRGTGDRGKRLATCHILPQRWLDLTEDEEHRILEIKWAGPSQDTHLSSCMVTSRRLLEDCAARAFLKLNLSPAEESHAAVRS